MHEDVCKLGIEDACKLGNFQVSIYNIDEVGSLYKDVYVAKLVELSSGD